MSRTKARVISSLRMRRCSQRRKMTNCTTTGTNAVSQLILDTRLAPLARNGGGLLGVGWACLPVAGRPPFSRLSLSEQALLVPYGCVDSVHLKSGSKLPHSKLEEETGDAA